MPTFDAGSVQLPPAAQEASAASTDPMLAMLAGMWSTIFEQQVLPEGNEGVAGWQLGSGVSEEEKTPVMSEMSRSGIASAVMGNGLVLDAAFGKGVSVQMGELVKRLQGQGGEAKALMESLVAEVEALANATPIPVKEGEATQAEAAPVEEQKPPAAEAETREVKVEVVPVPQSLVDLVVAAAAPAPAAPPVVEQPKVAPVATEPIQALPMEPPVPQEIAVEPETPRLDAVAPKTTAPVVAKPAEPKPESAPVAKEFVTELELRKQIAAAPAPEIVAKPIEPKPEAPKVEVAPVVVDAAPKVAVEPAKVEAAPVKAAKPESAEAPAPVAVDAVAADAVQPERRQENNNSDDSEQQPKDPDRETRTAAKVEEVAPAPEPAATPTIAAAPPTDFASRLSTAVEAATETKRPAPARPVEVPQSFANQPRGEAKTISIRIPLTEADRAGGQRRHVDVVFQHRNSDVTLQFRSPTGEIQRNIEDSIPALMERLRGEDWTAKPQEPIPATLVSETITETRRKPDAMFVPTATSEAVRETAPASQSSSSGFSFDDAPSNGGQDSQRQQGRNPKRQQQFQAAFEEQQA